MRPNLTGTFDVDYFTDVEIFTLFKSIFLSVLYCFLLVVFNCF